MVQPNSSLLDSQPEVVRDVALVPADRPADGFAAVIERVAMSPDVDVVKLEKIIELQERILRHNAKSAFDAGFARMSAALPEVEEHGQIAVRGTVRSTYAKLEDIHKAIKPILTRHGFAIRHRTEWPVDKPGVIRVVGILSHQDGHSEESAFEAPMDRSEFRTDIQSMGSTVSYGRRYTTLDLLNIATRAADDDGSTSGRPMPPDGLEAWWAVMEGIAADGTKALDEAWGKAKPDFKTYTVTHNRDAWNTLKATAAKVKSR